MNFDQLKAILAKYGLTLIQEKGGFRITGMETGKEYTFKTLAEVETATRSSFPEAFPEGGGEAGEEGTKPVPGLPYPEFFQAQGMIFQRNPVTGEITKIANIPVAKETKVPALTFTTKKDAYDYMDRYAISGLEPYWDEKAQAYKLRELRKAKAEIGHKTLALAEVALAEMGDSNLMVAFDDQTQRYYLVNKPIEEGFRRRADAEAALAASTDPTLQIFFDTKTQRYFLSQKLVAKEELGFKTRAEAERDLAQSGDPNLMVAWDDNTQRYYLVNKPATPAAQKGFATRRDAEAALAASGDPTLQIFFDTANQRYFLSQKPEAREEITYRTLADAQAALSRMGDPTLQVDFDAATQRYYLRRPEEGLAAPEFWTDPNTGQKLVRRTPGGEWEDFNEYAPSLIQMRDKALAQGNVALAQALETFRTQPTQAEALRLGMEIMQSPGDFWTYEKLSRGMQANVPYDVSGQAIPRTWLQDLRLGLPATTAEQLARPMLQAQTTLPLERALTPAEKRQIALRTAFLEEPQGARFFGPQPPPVPEKKAVIRYYVEDPDTGYRQYLSPQEVSWHRAAGYGSEIREERYTPPVAGEALRGMPGVEAYEKKFALTQPIVARQLAASQIAGIRGGYETEPIPTGEYPAPANEQQEAFKRAGQSYLTAAGYNWIPGGERPKSLTMQRPAATDEWESVPTSEHPVAASVFGNVEQESRRRSGLPYLTVEGKLFNPAMQVKKPLPSPGTALATQLSTPTLSATAGTTQPQGALPVPTFLQALAQGQNVGRARQMPTFGFPNFLSAQGWQNLTVPEQEILQAEVKAQGGYWPQYAREMQATWPTWTKRGAFMRQPSYMGV